MNLNEYFSKYIDGELSAAEDAEMRLHLSEDAGAREAFEHAALISVAMHQDAEETELPDDLFEFTDSLVVAKMETFAKQNAPRRNYRALVALPLALMLTALISDGPFEFTGIGNSAKIGRAQITQNSELAKNKPSVAAASNTSRHQSYASNLQELDGFNSQSQNFVEPNNSDNQQVIVGSQGLANVQFFAPVQAGSSSLKTNQGAESSSALQKNTQVPAIAWLANSGADSKTSLPPDVQISSFAGSIVQSSAKVGSGQHYSTSLAYRVTDRDHFGIEVGSFSLVSTSDQLVGANTTVSPNDGSGLHKGTVLDADRRVDAGGSIIPSRFASIPVEQTRSVVWGAAFFEHAIIREQDLSLKARVGVGTSYDGPIVLARAFSAYRVAGPLSVTLGTEGRMYFSDDKNGISSEAKLQTMMSIVYGIQLKF